MKTNKSFFNSAVYSLAVLAFTVGCTSKKRDAKDIIPANPQVTEHKDEAPEADIGREQGDQTVNEQPPKKVVEAAEPPEKKDQTPPVVDTGASDKDKADKKDEKQEAKPVIVENKTTDQSKTETPVKEVKSEAAPTKMTKPAGPAANSATACVARMNTPEKLNKRKKDFEDDQKASSDSEYKKILEQRKAFEKLRAERIEAKAKSKGDAAKASDSDEIKNKPSMKISFKNFKLLMTLSDTDKVLFNSKVVDAKTAEAKLEKGNEDHYCRVEGAYAFNSADHLELTEGSDKFLVNEAKDIYDTRLEFSNKNGTLSFICNHAAAGFFVQDFAGNFKDYLEVKADTTVITDKDFVNPISEDRRLEAIQLLDTAKLDKVVLTENTTEGMALSKGEVVSSDKVSTEIAAGNEKIACMINNKQGEFDKKKVYIRVETGIAMETPANIPSATVYAVYRADEKTSFTLACLIDKRSPWSTLFNTAKDVIKFGALDRLAFLKKSAEVKRIHEGLQKPVAQDLSSFELTEVDCLKVEAGEQAAASK